MATPAHRLHGAFGEDTFGRLAERTARFFGTPQYIVGQTVAVVLWIALNSVALLHHWDPYPFILLNLAFSTQAAYAAPLILLAQTRQADRDKLAADRTEQRHAQLQQAEKDSTDAIRAETDRLLELLESNTALTRRDAELTEQVAGLAREIHALLTQARESS